MLSLLLCMATAMTAETPQMVSRFLLVAFTTSMYGDSHDRGNTAGGFEVLARCFHYFLCMATAMTAETPQMVSRFLLVAFTTSMYGDSHDRGNFSHYSSTCSFPSTSAKKHASPTSIFACPEVPSVISACTGASCSSDSSTSSTT